MAKRKKNVKPNKKIHKIASTLSMVPLVAMSPFLFSASYALAGTVALPSTKIIDISKQTEYTIDHLFTDFGNYSLYKSGAFVSSSPESMFYITSSTEWSLKPKQLGTATITVKAMSNADTTFLENTFTVNVIEPAFVVNSLDSDSNGLDIANIVTAASATSPLHTAADLNGDGVVDRIDYSSLLGFIQPLYANHNPTISVPLPNRHVTPGYSMPYSIELNDYFGDPDSGDVISYRAYSKDDAVGTTTTVTPTFYNSITSILDLSAVQNGTSTITVVADDHKGGYKIGSFIATAAPNNPPVGTLNDIVFQDQYIVNLNSLFTDADGDVIHYNNPTVGGTVSVNYNNGQVTLSSASNSYRTVSINADDYNGVGTTKSFEARSITNTFSNNIATDLLLSQVFNSTSNITAFSFTSPVNSSIADIAYSAGSGSGNIGKLTITGHSVGTFTFTISATQDNTIINKTFALKIQ